MGINSEFRKRAKSLVVNHFEDIQRLKQQESIYGIGVTCHDLDNTLRGRLV